MSAIFGRSLGRVVDAGSPGKSTPAGLTLLDTKTASASATIEFTSFITATYEEYLLSLYDVAPATDNVGFYLRVSQDGGSTYKSGAGNYSWGFTGITTSTPGAVVDGSDADTKLQIGGASTSLLGNLAGEEYSASIRLFNPSGAAEHKRFLWSANWSTQASSILIPGAGGGSFTLNNNAVDAIQFLMSSGNIATGTFKLYGVQK